MKSSLQNQKITSFTLLILSLYFWFCLPYEAFSDVSNSEFSLSLYPSLTVSPSFSALWLFFLLNLTRPHSFSFYILVWSRELYWESVTFLSSLSTYLNLSQPLPPKKCKVKNVLIAHPYLIIMLFLFHKESQNSSSDLSSHSFTIHLHFIPSLINQ